PAQISQGRERNSPKQAAGADYGHSEGESPTGQVRHEARQGDSFPGDDRQARHDSELDSRREENSENTAREAWPKADSRADSKACFETGQGERVGIHADSGRTQETGDSIDLAKHSETDFERRRPR